MTQNLLGIHFVDDIYTEAEIAKHMAFLRILNPAWINILGGSQHKEALGMARTVRRDLPGTRVMFRHWKDGGDNGMHTRLTAKDWWEKIGSQYIGMDLTIVTDNESNPEDWSYYVDWHIEAMTLAAAHNVSLGYGRFSTHNPPKAKFSQFDRMFRKAVEFGKLHFHTPNVYWDEDNDDGHEYPFYAIQRCADAGIQPPQIVIGEYAYAFNLAAHNGYKYNGINGGDYIRNLLIPRFQKYFAAAGIAACIFGEGLWPMGNNEDGKSNDTFGLDDDAKTALKEYAAKLPPPIIVVPPKPAPVPKPTNAGAGTKRIVIPPAPILNFRDGPNENYTKIGEIKAGQEIMLYLATKRIDPDNKDQHWYWFESDKGAGWVADVNGKVDFKLVIPPPTIPPATQLAWDAVQLAINQYDVMIAEFTSKKALLELALKTAKDSYLPV